MNLRILGGSLAIVLTLLAAACGTKEVAMEAGYEQNQASALRSLGRRTESSPPQPAAAFASNGRVEAATVDLGDLAASQPDRYLIKNGSMTLEVKDARQVSQRVVETVKVEGGYISNLNEYAGAFGVRGVSMTVRVPADRFEQVMQQLEAMGRALNRSVHTEDVTEEFLDTEARLRNLKKTEERLLDHLGRAVEIESIIRVEQEMTRVRNDIERFEGRIRFLTHRIAYSTIDMTLQETPKAESITPVETFSLANIGSKALRGVVAFLQNVLAVATYTVIWGIVWVPIVLLMLLIVFSIRRKRRTQSAAPPPGNTG